MFFRVGCIERAEIGQWVGELDRAGLDRVYSVASGESKQSIFLALSGDQGVKVSVRLSGPNLSRALNVHLN